MRDERGTPDDDAWEAPLPHVGQLDTLLRDAASLDQVARGVLAHLVDLPGADRVAMGLAEGAGRRLRFVSSNRLDQADLPWCHIDAYDDVPLTEVTRTGEDVLGSLDQLQERFPGVVAHQREAGTCSIAAVPLPGLGSPVGGLIVFFGTEQRFDAPQRRLLHEAARRVADAVRRVLTATDHSLVDPVPESSAERGQHARIELDGDPLAARAARRFLREQLAEWQVDDDTIDSAELCASELVNNVIMHAHSAFRLNAHLEDDGLTVTVRDRGVGSDEAAHTPVDDDDAMRVFGRGLTLVDAIADRWGSDRDATGTIAWFVLGTGGDRSSAPTG